MYKRFINILVSGGMIYLGLFLIFYVLVDEDRSRIKALNHTMPPSFTHMINVIENGSSVNQEIFKEYLKYFQQTTNYISYNPSTHGLKGYCAYQLGKKRDAKNYLQTAHKQNPKFFWFLYNLGWMAYQEKDYETAINYLEQARNSPLKENFLFIFKSKAYFPLFKRYEGREDELQKILKKRMIAAYEKSYIALILSHTEAEHFKEVLALSMSAQNPNFKNQEFFHYYAQVASLQLEHFRKTGRYSDELFQLQKQDQLLKRINLDIQIY